MATHTDTVSLYSNTFCYTGGCNCQLKPLIIVWTFALVRSSLVWRCYSPVGEKSNEFCLISDYTKLVVSFRVNCASNYMYFNIPFLISVRIIASPIVF